MEIKSLFNILTVAVAVLLGVQAAAQLLYEKLSIILYLCGI